MTYYVLIAKQKYLNRKILLCYYCNMMLIRHQISSFEKFYQETTVIFRNANQIYALFVTYNKDFTVHNTHLFLK